MDTGLSSRRVFATSATGGRDRFLDTLRTVALFRVMLWHAFGEPVLTYVVAAVPAMFFVTGSLLAKSLDRRPWPGVLFDRARRVLVPLWVFAAVAFVAMRAAHEADPSARTQVPWRSIVFWILPLGDPQGSAWEGGWMSQPLWYVRAMFWLLLLSPLLRAAVRRLGGVALLPPLVVVFALDVLARDPSFTLRAAPDLVWQLGDLALYSVFLMAGFLHREGRFDHLGPRGWGKVAVGATVAAVAWIATQPVPLHVVNNSHPAHLFVGAAWLSVLFAMRLPISRWSARPRPRALVDWVSQRTMTIYLWHSTAIILTFQVLARRASYPTGVYAAAMIGGMLGVTVLLVLAFGWIEDVAARRAPRVCPLLVPPGDTPSERVRFAHHRRLVHRAVGVPAFAGLVLVGIVAATVGPHDTASAESAAGTDQVGAAAQASTRRPPVPSQAPPRPQFEATNAPATTLAPRTAVLGATRDATGATGARATAPTVDPEPLAPAADAALAAVLQRTIDEWHDRWAVPGVTVGVLVPGEAEWHGAVGADAVNGLAVTATDHFDIGSITKTFTGTLVFQLAAEGRIALDAPLPKLTLVPEFPYDKGITVRQLLTHATGIPNYRDTPTFAAAPDAIDTPAEALAASLREPLHFAPGTSVEYSSSNFLVLGFLLEQVTGQTFDELLRTRVLDPAGLVDLVHRAPEPQAPNFSTSGIVTDTATLLRWAVALYRDHVVLDADALADMHRIDTTTGLGAASYGYCPCTVDPDGTSHWRWIGHSGGTTQLVYSDVDDLAIALNVTDSLWLADRGRAVAELLELVRNAMLEARPPAALPGFATEASGATGSRRPA
jgi:CubicO group peptidase (beta-lactamase class C family)/surface polysaccharide O-acyltransferase-like enzyme